MNEEDHLRHNRRQETIFPQGQQNVKNITCKQPLGKTKANKGERRPSYQTSEKRHSSRWKKLVNNFDLEEVMES